ncbi:MAG: hypothetical protein PHQ95_00065 [Candidatus Gracilibacteria bacterium]|nr:hypothetical protein [Candidatus Gracilibacteria bacterium]
MTAKINTTHENQGFFREVWDAVDTKTATYLIRFEDGGFEKLIDRWWEFYFKKQTEYINEEEFKNYLREMIGIYIRYITVEKDEPFNSEKSARIKWIRETYKELLYEELHGDTTKKQEALIKQVGKRGIVLQILDWTRGK